MGAYDSAALLWRMTGSRLVAALELEVQKLSGLPSDELSPGGANKIATGVEYLDAFRRDERASAGYHRTTNKAYLKYCIPSS